MDKFFSKYNGHLYSVEKLYDIRGTISNDTYFFENFFFPLWTRFGNQHMKNFNRVWKWISNLNIRKMPLNSLDGNGQLIPLFRCMTIEEYNLMKDGTIKSPSWTSDYKSVTHFKNHQIQTKSTLKSVIVFSLFDFNDILYVSQSYEGECFLKSNAKPKKTEILVEWGIDDVERIFGNEINLLFITHKECGNGFSDVIETLLKRGLNLKGWFKGENNVWYCETDYKIKEGYNKIDSIIDSWNRQLCCKIES